MLRAFWTWNPVCSGEFRRFDEPYMVRHNQWLFDENLWRSMFRRMAEFGFNAMFFANTHPFTFMVQLDDYPQAGLLSDVALERYQQAYHRIFQLGLEHGIDTYLLFFSIYYPEPMLDHLGLHDRAAYAASDLAIGYTRACVEETLRTYPELAGIVGDASENIHGKRGTFLRQAIAEPFERLAAGRRLMFRGWWSDIDELRRELTDATRVPITFSVKYTWEHLVHHDPDRLFLDWIDAVGGPNVMAEFWISNVEPFTCFAYPTIERILANLKRLNTAGFSLHPLSIYEWPFTSDKCWEHQFERDSAYYSAWGEGDSIPDEQRALIEDDRVRPGLEAASEILKTVALYFAGDRQNQWRPQFASSRHSDGVRLLTIEDMCRLSQIRSDWSGGSWPPFDCLDWRTRFTGRPTMHFEDYDPSQTDAYGPLEFASETDELASAALAAVDYGRSRYTTPGQECLLKNAESQAHLGRFWAERARAALAHIRGDRSAAGVHVCSALQHFRRLVEIESSHRGPFRAITGRCAQVGDWNSVLHALECEHSDYAAGRPTGIYYSGSVVHRDTSSHPRGMFEMPECGGVDLDSC